MKRTEKLLAELIALPSVNPAFVTPAMAGTARCAATEAKFRPPRAGGDAAAQRSDRGCGEKDVADFLASVAARAGLDVELHSVLPGRPNVIARLRPRDKIRQTILLAPHLDTVGAEAAQFVPRRKSGRLYGRGACDTKGSAAAMLTALSELAAAKSCPRETEIIFAGLVDEEHAQAGSRALVRNPAFKRLRQPAVTTGRRKAGQQTILAIVGEPTRLQVVTAHKGSLWLQLETRGLAAHGATPQLGRNAVHEMARVVDLIETEYAGHLRRRRHPLLGTATVSVGTISGGTQPNIVPDRCTITLDRRTLPGESDEGVRQEIAALLRAKRLSAAPSGLKLAPCLPLETDRNLPLVRQLMQSLGQTRPVGVDFFCDAAVLAEGGIPSVVFGPGDIAQAHTADEWISLDSLERGKNLLLRFLKSLP